jgi:hypothetical protein
MLRAVRHVRPRYVGLAVGAGSRIGRIVFRKRIARARRNAMTVVAAATVGGLVVLVLAAEREHARDGA